MVPAPRVWRRAVAGIAAALTVAGTLDCAQAVSHLGRTGVEASAHADTLLLALGARFGPTQLDQDLAQIRPRLQESALTPSRIFDDAAIWTQMQGDVRVLELAGARTDSDYMIGVVPNAPVPSRVADYHGTILLQRIERGVYEWREHEALSVGRVGADDLSNALTALFTAAEHERPADVRAAYRAALPRTTRALGRLFSLDTVQLAPAREGGTSVVLGFTAHPEQLRDSFPHYAHFLDKYLSPAHVQLAVYDDTGAEWWTAQSEGLHITVRLRVHDGSLAPLDGAPRAIPAALHVRFDAETKMFVFHIGVHHLVGDVALTRTAHDKGFAVTFQHEPEWVLPPFVAKMMRNALERPFMGGGAQLAFGVRDSDTGATLATHDYRIAVEESSLTRWVGGLGNSAFSDFEQGAEVEADRFTGEAFAALQHDVSAMALTAGTE
ncbi:MAG TPA: hypothetical protein VFJ96_00630 [Gemmatimonadaceae bacterium]|jgi:hypothetical protein|nr:hypothetical protein [Gemmatimonadaceae bacterium]